MERKTPPYWVLLLLAGHLLLAGLYLFCQWIGRDTPLTGLTDLDGEAVLPSWWSSIQLFVVAQVWAFVAYTRWQAGRLAGGAVEAGLLAALFLGLSADEAASLHERVAHHLDAWLLPGGERGGLIAVTGVWLFVLGPIALAVLGTLFWRLSRLTGWRAGKLLLIGLVVFIGGAAGVELFANFADKGGGSMLYPLQVTLEELLEMTGVTLILWGSVTACQAITPHAAPAAQLQPQPRHQPRPPSNRRRSARPESATPPLVAPTPV